MNRRVFTTLFIAACLGLAATPAAYGQWTQPMPQQPMPPTQQSTDVISNGQGWQQMPQQQMPPMQQMPQQPMQQMPPMPPGPLDGMWMANNGVSAMFNSNFYVIAANGQAMEGGSFMIQGSEMITQIMQGQGAGQQMRYNYQPGADGRSFTLSMQNGSASITYQKTGELPQQPYPQATPQQMPPQQFPQPTPQQYPQPMPQQYPQQMPQQYPQQMPQQYPQQIPQPYPQPMPQQYPQMQQMPQQW
jgi:hypothetical protein